MISWVKNVPSNLENFYHCGQFPSCISAKKIIALARKKGCAPSFNIDAPNAVWSLQFL
jgi:hypothetical protein